MYLLVQRLKVGTLVAGVEHGPGYPAGSVTGPVALAAQMYDEGTAMRLLPDAAWPAGHTR